MRRMFTSCRSPWTFPQARHPRRHRSRLHLRAMQLLAQCDALRTASCRTSRAIKKSPVRLRAHDDQGVAEACFSSSPRSSRHQAATLNCHPTGGFREASHAAPSSRAAVHGGRRPPSTRPTSHVTATRTMGRATAGAACLCCQLTNSRGHRRRRTPLRCAEPCQPPCPPGACGVSAGAAMGRWRAWEVRRNCTIFCYGGRTEGCRKRDEEGGWSCTLLGLLGSLFFLVLPRLAARPGHLLLSLGIDTEHENDHTIYPHTHVLSALCARAVGFAGEPAAPPRVQSAVPAA